MGSGRIIDAMTELGWSYWLRRYLGGSPAVAFSKYPADAPQVNDEDAWDEPLMLEGDYPAGVPWHEGQEVVGSVHEAIVLAALLALEIEEEYELTKK